MGSILEDLALQAAEANAGKNEQDFIAPSIIDRQFSSDADIRRWMTAAKAMMPIMSAALTLSTHKNPDHPDATLSVEDVAYRLMTLLKATAEITATLEKDITQAGMPIEGFHHRWAVRKLFSLSANLVAQQYKQHKNIDIESLKRLSCGLFSVLSGKPSMLENAMYQGNRLLNEQLSSSLSDFQNLLYEISEEDKYPNLPHEIAVQFAMENSLTEILHDVSQFNLCLSNDDALEFAITSICHGAKTILKSAYGKYMESEVSDETRTALIQSCFDKSRRLLQGVWQNERLQFYNRLGVSNPDLEFYKNYKKESIGQRNVDKNFNETLGSYIGACQKGKLFVEALLFKGVFDIDPVKGNKL